MDLVGISFFLFLFFQLMRVTTEVKGGLKVQINNKKKSTFIFLEGQLKPHSTLSARSRKRTAKPLYHLLTENRVLQF